MEFDTFDIQRSLRAMWDAMIRRGWMVVLGAVVAAALMAAYIHYFPWVYAGAVKLLVEPEKNPGRDQFYARWNVFRNADEPSTEAELIKTAPVVEEVVTRLDLKYDDVYHPILRTLVDLWARSWVGRNYQKIKHKIWPPEKGPYDPTPEEREYAMTVFDFQKGIVVESVGTTNVARITVLGPSKRVAEMANLLVDVYLTQRNERHRQEAMAAYEKLTEQVDRAKAKLVNAEHMFQAFADKHNLKFEFDKERGDVQSLSGAEVSLQKTQSSIKQAQARLAEIDRQLKNEEREETLGRAYAANDLKNRMKATRLEQRLSLLTTQQRFTDEAPEVKEIQENVRNLDEMVKEAEDMTVSGQTLGINPVWSNLRVERSTAALNLAELQMAEKAYQDSIDNYNRKLADLPEKQVQVIDLKRELAMADEEYRVLLEKQVQAYLSGVSESRETGSLKVVEAAAVPEKPKRPNPKLYMLAAVLVGLVLGVAAAFVADYFDDTIQSGDNLEGALSVPVFAQLALGPVENVQRLYPQSRETR